MKRLALVAFALITAAATACGNDKHGPTTPTDTFSGTWTGNLAGLSSLPVTVVSTQSGANLTGTTSVTFQGTAYAGTFTGTSTPPTLTLAFALGDTVGAYTATYITPDSVAGTFTVTSPVTQSAALSLKKQ